MRAMAGAGLLTTTLIVSACAVGPDPGPDLCLLYTSDAADE